MRLHEVFPDPPNASLRRAAVCDDWEAFVAAADRHPAPPAATLLAEADALAARLEARAETGFVPARLADADPARPVINAGQQAYIDYRLGMAAKVDALEGCRAPAFCDWVEYDTFASDRLFSRTDLPSPDPRSAEPRLTLRFHPGARTHGKKDLRRVPPPDAAALARVRAELRGAVTLAARAVPGFDPRAARQALDRVWEDYAFAAARAEHAGDFNLLWTTRTLRRLGWRTPFVPLGELWDAPGSMRGTAETLVPFVRENACFVEAANEGIGLAAPHDCGMSPRPPGHLPLALTDPATGIRFPAARGPPRRGPRGRGGRSGAVLRLRRRGGGGRLARLPARAPGARDAERVRADLPVPRGGGRRAEREGRHPLHPGGRPRAGAALRRPPSPQSSSAPAPTAGPIPSRTPVPPPVRRPRRWSPRCSPVSSRPIPPLSAPMSPPSGGERRVRGRGALSLPLRGGPSPVPGEGGGLGIGAPCARSCEIAVALPVRDSRRRRGFHLSRYGRGGA